MKITPDDLFVNFQSHNNIIITSGGIVPHNCDGVMME